MSRVRLLGGTADGQIMEVARGTATVRIPIPPSAPTLAQRNPTARAEGPRIEEYSVEGSVAVARHHRLCDGCRTEIIRYPDECTQCYGNDPYGSAFCPNCDFCCGC